MEKVRAGARGVDSGPRRESSGPSSTGENDENDTPNENARALTAPKRGKRITAHPLLPRASGGRSPQALRFSVSDKDDDADDEDDDDEEEEEQGQEQEQAQKAKDKENGCVFPAAAAASQAAAAESTEKPPLVVTTRRPS